MKLLELIPLLKDYTRIKRDRWASFLVKPSNDDDPLVQLDLESMIIKYYSFTYEDLLADDWHAMENE